MPLKIIHTGIIPFYYNTNNNQYYLFISEESHKPKKWCGFAGNRNHNEYINIAAAREGWEESMGLLGSQNSLLKKINSADFAIFSNNSNNASVQYLIRCDTKCYETLESNFNNVCQYIRECNGTCQGKVGCYEKSRGKWFPLTQLLQCAIHGNDLGNNMGHLRDLFGMSLTVGNIIRNPTKDTFNRYY